MVGTTQRCTRSRQSPCWANALGGYSKECSSEISKLKKSIKIIKLSSAFNLPRPTNSKHQQNPPSAGFVVYERLKAQPVALRIFPSRYRAIGELFPLPLPG
jgi:hypothetical protein